MCESKWLGVRDAFHRFEIARVADLTSSGPGPDGPGGTGAIRNRRKLEAVVANAQRLIELEREHGSIKNYFGTLGDDFDAKVKRLRKDFKFLGNFGSYYFLYVVGEEVPDHETWMKTQARRK